MCSRNLGSFPDESRSLVFHVFLLVSESQIFFARSRSLRFAFLAEVLWVGIALSKQSVLLRLSMAFTLTAGNTELLLFFTLLLLLYSLSLCTCSFDQVSADNNHVHALMLKSHENMVSGLYF